MFNKIHVIILLFVKGKCNMVLLHRSQLNVSTVTHLTSFFIDPFLFGV